MAKKKKLSKKVKEYANVGADLIMMGPVLVPAITGTKYLLTTMDPEVAATNFVYDATGYNIDTNQLVEDKLAAVAKRDAVMLLGGYAIKVMLKKV